VFYSDTLHQGFVPKLHLITVAMNVCGMPARRETIYRGMARFMKDKLNKI